MRPRVLAALAAALAAGCGSASDDRPATLSYIAPAIFAPNCATSSCHSKSVRVSDLDFSTVKSSFESLTARKVMVTGEIDHETGKPATYDRQLVEGQNPDQSRLILMLRGRGTDRMPPDRPLAEADIQLVEQWILDGAKDN